MPVRRIATAVCPDSSASFVYNIKRATAAKLRVPENSACARAAPSPTPIKVTAKMCCMNSIHDATTSTRRQGSSHWPLSGRHKPASIALMLGVHVSIITRLVQRCNTTGGTRDRPRPGQPWITTPRQDRQIVRHHLRDHFLSATESARNVIGKRGGPVHPITIARRLRERRIRCRRPYNGNILTQRHRAARVQRAGRCCNREPDSGPTWSSLTSHSSLYPPQTVANGSTDVATNATPNAVWGNVIDLGVEVWWSGAPLTIVSNLSWSSLILTPSVISTRYRDLSWTLWFNVVGGSFSFNRTMPDHTLPGWHNSFSSAMVPVSSIGPQTRLISAPLNIYGMNLGDVYVNVVQCPGTSPSCLLHW